MYVWSVLQGLVIHSLNTFRDVFRIWDWQWVLSLIHTHTGTQAERTESRGRWVWIKISQAYNDCRFFFSMCLFCLELSSQYVLLYFVFFVTEPAKVKESFFGYSLDKHRHVGNIPCLLSAQSLHFIPRQEVIEGVLSGPPSTRKYHPRQGTRAPGALTRLNLPKEVYYVILQSAFPTHKVSLCMHVCQVLNAVPEDLPAALSLYISRDRSVKTPYLLRLFTEDDGSEN